LGQFRLANITLCSQALGTEEPAAAFLSGTPHTWSAADAPFVARNWRFWLQTFTPLFDAFTSNSRPFDGIAYEL
jgi:hypothetical protein